MEREEPDGGMSPGVGHRYTDGEKASLQQRWLRGQQEWEDQDSGLGSRGGCRSFSAKGNRDTERLEAGECDPRSRITRGVFARYTYRGGGPDPAVMAPRGGVGMAGACVRVGGLYLLSPLSTSHPQSHHTTCGLSRNPGPALQAQQIHCKVPPLV